LRGMSQAEIAQELNASQPTISRRLDRAVAELREILQRAGTTIPATGFPALLASRGIETPSATLIESLGKMAVAGVGSAPATVTSSAVIGSKFLIGGALAIILLAAGAIAVVKLFPSTPAAIPIRSVPMTFAGTPGM